MGPPVVRCSAPGYPTSAARVGARLDVGGRTALGGVLALAAALVRVSPARFGLVLAPLALLVGGLACWIVRHAVTPSRDSLRLVGGRLAALAARRLLLLARAALGAGALARPARAGLLATPAR